MIHVAVLLKPYLDLVLSGEKTVECRLTQQARAPFDAIEPGERVYFKQSSGPYRATALVEHVQFESNCFPQHIRRLKRDYNDFICGEPDFWKQKLNSKYATLIWLKDVTPIDSGPEIRPLQGVAWLTMEEEPAWRRRDSDAVSCEGCFGIEITEGNLRNNSLYVTHVKDHFPKRAIGGRTKLRTGRPLTLTLADGPTVETDIVGPRNMFRTRVWGRWFREHDAQPGDQVVFTPLDETTYFVGLSRG